MKKKVIVFGNQQIAIDGITILQSHPNVELMFVVGCETKEDLKRGYSSVKKFCKTNGVSYFQPEKLDDAFLQKLLSYRPDFCFSLYYRHILKRGYIALPKDGFFNIHPSLLPKYRGPAPTMWMLLNNEAYAGMTLHVIDEGIDTGDIVGQVRFLMPKEITGFELNNLAMLKGIELFEKHIEKIIAKKNKRIKQINSQATYYGQFRPKLLDVDWTKGAKAIVSQTRAFAAPYSGARVYIKGETVIVWSARYFGRPTKNFKGPGRVVKVDKHSFIVTTVDALLEITKYETHATISIGSKFDI
jgi:methionyl-tRNA formyltransferase